MPVPSFNLLNEPSLLFSYPNAWSVVVSMHAEYCSHAVAIPTRIMLKSMVAQAEYIASELGERNSRHHISDADVARFLAEVANRPDEPGYADMKNTADDMLSKVINKGTRH